MPQSNGSEMDTLEATDLSVVVLLFFLQQKQNVGVSLLITESSTKTLSPALVLRGESEGMAIDAVFKLILVTLVSI